MQGLFRKLLTGVTAVAMVASMSISAIAQTEMTNMVFAGYDTTDPSNPNKVYNEVINGKYTNKQILVPVTPEWRIEGYESVYPYAGYSRMYLEGNRQEITAYNNLSPQWETRRKDYMWEMAYPYNIWERQQTKVNNKTWQWDFGNSDFNIPDSALLNRTNREAVVLDITMKNYGFGRYTNNGTVLNASQERMYSDFGVNAISTWNNLVSTSLSVASLSATDDNNCYVLSDEEIAAMIPVVQTKYITAKFNESSRDGLATKNVADEYLAHMNDGWRWDSDSFGIVNTASISWTSPSYEMAEPYNYYQYLIVNGVVLDGTNGKDRIYRYTGGKASPKITWKFAFFQNAKDASGNILSNVYEVVERKYVDGVAAVDAYGNPIYRVPTGEYGNTYFVINKSTIEYWVVDASGNKTLLKVFDKFEGRMNGVVDDGVLDENDLVNAYTSGAFNYTQAQ